MSEIENPHKRLRKARKQKKPTEKWAKKQYKGVRRSAWMILMKA